MYISPITLIWTPLCDIQPTKTIQTRMRGKAQPDGRPVVEFIDDGDSRQTVNF